MYELLIVDDEANSRDILASCFPWHEQGFHVCGQKGNGREALDFLNDHMVHVILTDISMPDMDGIELAKIISEASGSRPMIVFLSAYDNFSYAQKGMRYGVRYYVLKPTNFSELKEIFGNIKRELDIKYQAAPDPDTASSPDEIIQKVSAYCSRNYRDGSLSALAESLYLNPSYLSLLIKQKTSKTFSDLLTEARMKQAALLLKDPDAKIYNISAMIGYVNPNNFTRAFKSYWGITPSEYRSHEK